MTTQNSELEGQIALVTGASRGIGRAIAQELVQRG
ncbi:MAG: SDR family NAD(P)-dependent oxidoreductase, partial [Herbaspirillum sp.]